MTLVVLGKYIYIEEEEKLHKARKTTRNVFVCDIVPFNRFNK